MSPPESDPSTFRFSYGRFVLFVLGSGVLVLLIAIPIILALAHWNPVAGLIGAVLAVLAMVTAIGVVAQRQIGLAERQMRAAQDADSRLTDPD